MYLLVLFNIMNIRVAYGETTETSLWPSTFFDRVLTNV